MKVIFMKNTAMALISELTASVKVELCCDWLVCATCNNYCNPIGFDNASAWLVDRSGLPNYHVDL